MSDIRQTVTERAYEIAQAVIPPIDSPVPDPPVAPPPPRLASRISMPDMPGMALCGAGIAICLVRQTT
jgi:hypothetical protein